MEAGVAGWGTGLAEKEMEAEFGVFVAGQGLP